MESGLIFNEDALTFIAASFVITIIVFVFLKVKRIGCKPKKVNPKKKKQS